MPDRPPDHRHSADAVLRLERGELRQRLHVDGFLQFHTFENMMLKVSERHIQDGCAVTFGATVMGGAVIERDTTLLPLSLVLKEMRLLTATYEGSPAEPVSSSTLLPPPIVLRQRNGGHPELIAAAPINDQKRLVHVPVSDAANRERADQL